MEAEAKFPLVVAVITGAIVGAAIVQGLNARAKSPVYFVTEIDVKDVDRYVNEFVPLAQASVTNHGGKLLAAGPNVTPLKRSPAKARCNQPLGQHGELTRVAQFSGLQKSARDRRKVRNFPLLYA